mmetsp:Transcript_7984/g.17790  ORF Transcript_7984/g.17790 Transcript_7984/m.17790 type:complete len:350 (-) Transcript_7984:111-1160(-)
MSAAAASPQDPKDPKGIYALLGIPTNADQTEIRKAYRKLALQVHPDKNPDDPTANERFQQICTAYEVLSDESRRSMYDRTGCLDAEELDSMDMHHAEDVFSFFFQAFGEELDPDEQFFMDELFRMNGSAFRSKGNNRRGKKAGKKERAAARSMEEQFLNEVFGMGGAASSSSSAPKEMLCPQGHALKKRKSDEVYECDKCGHDIPSGKRFYDCRSCNYSACLRCFKAHAVRPGQADEEEDDLPDDFLETFCRDNMTCNSRGDYQCNFCKRTFKSETLACLHMEEDHEDIIEEAVCQMMGGGGAFDDPFMGGFGGLEAAVLLEEMLGGLGAGMPTSAAGKGKGRGSRKKR